MCNDLSKADKHFAFGKNWAAYAAKISPQAIKEAEAGLLRLLDSLSLEGKRFLDLGCGSGLHSLAALRLGAKDVLAVDIDPDSVATTHAVLQGHAPGKNWQAVERSVFDLSREEWGAFDVVYSWGVLHHTGDMRRALRCAAALVTPGGRFVFALYRRIWMDPFWRWEKRWYAQASPKAQRRARAVYISLFRLRLRVTGRSFSHYVEGYHANRGMDFYHDVHDWMGGWPYESISAFEVDQVLRELGFALERSLVRSGRLFGRHLGFFGSGCDEYVYRRV